MLREVQQKKRLSDTWCISRIFFFFSLKNRGLVRRVGLQRLPVLKRILFQKQEKDTEKISKLVKFGFTWILTEAPLRRK